MSKTTQADGGVHENQLLNFLVNTLDEEVDLGLGGNAKIEAEDIYEVLVGACRSIYGAIQDDGTVSSAPPIITGSKRNSSKELLKL